MGICLRMHGSCWMRRMLSGAGFSIGRRREVKVEVVRRLRGAQFWLIRTINCLNVGFHTPPNFPRTGVDTTTDSPEEAEVWRGQFFCILHQQMRDSYATRRRADPCSQKIEQFAEVYAECLEAG